jgi:type III secretion system YscI/HrpB-like protein
MDISAISNTALQSLPSNELAANINVPDVRDIETFKKMMASSQPVPEAQMVDALQQQQEMFASTVTKVNSITRDEQMSGTKADSVTNLLGAQYELFNLSFNLDLTAKVAGQFSQAINKLTTMQ